MFLLAQLNKELRIKKLTEHEELKEQQFQQATGYFEHNLELFREQNEDLP